MFSNSVCWIECEQSPLGGTISRFGSSSSARPPENTSCSLLRRLNWCWTLFAIVARGGKKKKFLICNARTAQSLCLYCRPIIGFIKAPGTRMMRIYGPNHNALIVHLIFALFHCTADKCLVQFIHGPALTMKWNVLDSISSGLYLRF